MFLTNKPLHAPQLALIGLLVFWPWLFHFLLSSIDTVSTFETAEALSSYTEEQLGYSLPTDSSLLSESTFKCDPEPLGVQEGGAEYLVYCLSEKAGRVNIALGEMAVSLPHDQFLPKEMARIAEREGGALNGYSCTNDIAYATLNELPGGITDCEIIVGDGSTIYASVYFFGFERTDEISHILSAHANGNVGNADMVKNSLRATIPSIKGVLTADAASISDNQ